MKIDNVYNQDDTLLRSVGLGLTKTLSKHIRWINRFENNHKTRVLVNFYLSLANDEEFILDAAVDDIVGTRVEGITNIVPRGIVSATNFSVVSSEFANPNQFISKSTHINDKYKKIYSKIKAVPVKITYEVKIILNSLLDIYKCWEKTVEALFNYHFFRIEYEGVPIDCVLELPDENDITFPDESSIDSDSNKELTFNISVSTYLPIFQINTEDLEICDNDDEIDWERLGIKRPDENYCENLVAGGATKRVYWYNIISEISDYRIERTKADGSPKKWNKFNIK